VVITTHPRAATAAPSRREIQAAGKSAPGAIVIPPTRIVSPSGATTAFITARKSHVGTATPAARTLTRRAAPVTVAKSIPNASPMSGPLGAGTT
jgi:hypothetical protein